MDHQYNQSTQNHNKGVSFFEVPMIVFDQRHTYSFVWIYFFDVLSNLSKKLTILTTFRYMLL